MDTFNPHNTTGDKIGLSRPDKTVDPLMPTDFVKKYIPKRERKHWTSMNLTTLCIQVWMLWLQQAGTLLPWKDCWEWRPIWNLDIVALSLEKVDPANDQEEEGEEGVFFDAFAAAPPVFGQISPQRGASVFLSSSPPLHPPFLWLRASD